MIVSLGSAGQISGRDYRPDTHLSQTLGIVSYRIECQYQSLLVIERQAVTSVSLFYQAKAHRRAIISYYHTQKNKSFSLGGSSYYLHKSMTKILNKVQKISECTHIRKVWLVIRGTIVLILLVEKKYIIANFLSESPYLDFWLKGKSIVTP